MKCTNGLVLQIMMAPTAQRRGAKPIPKAGGKWPIITIHTPPTLQSTLVFEGSEACRDLQRHLLSTAEELQPKPADASDEEDSSAQDSNLDNIDNGTDCTKQQGGGHCGQAAHVAVSRCSGVVMPVHTCAEWCGVAAKVSRLCAICVVYINSGAVIKLFLQELVPSWKLSLTVYGEQSLSPR